MGIAWQFGLSAPVVVTLLLAAIVWGLVIYRFAAPHRFRRRLTLRPRRHRHPPDPENPNERGAFFAQQKRR